MNSTQERKCNEWPLLSETEISAMCQSLPKWKAVKEQRADKVVDKLQLKFATKHFVDALNFIQQAGNAAELQGHHPGWYNIIYLFSNSIHVFNVLSLDFHLTGWNNIEVVIYTHSLSGLTENDFILAKTLDTIPVQYSKKHLSENPHFSS